MLNEISVPKAGDVVVCTNGSEIGKFAVLEGCLNRVYEKQMICYSASAFRDEEHVSCSGGPAYYVETSKLINTGRTIKRQFWKWKDGISGADNSDYYDLEVPVWEYISDKAHAIFEQVTVAEIYHRKDIKFAEELSSYPIPDQGEHEQRYSLYRGDYQLTNQEYPEKFGIKTYYDQCAKSILASYISFSNIYITTHDKPVGCGYLYTVTGAMQTAFRDKAELEQFLKAYDLRMFKPKGYLSAVLLSVGKTSNWGKLEWKAI